MDLAVDEQGLWVLWGSLENDGPLKVATIDVKSNRIERTWVLNSGITRAQKYEKNLSLKVRLLIFTTV